MRASSRPVILLGHGVRAAGAADLVPALLDMGVPTLSSWQAADLCDSNHPAYFGRPGQYGQRCANAVLAAADYVLAIGNRLSIWNVGYEGIRADQKLVMVDIDEREVQNHPRAEWVREDARSFLTQFVQSRFEVDPVWKIQCEAWRARYPWLEPGTHDDANGYIHSYRFTAALERFLKRDSVIVTDMGSAMCSAHQILRVRPPQRLMTSGGLGEMGCALPAAIGASFARDHGEVVCLTCDGGMMMNLQELQTIVHHKLPVKVIVYSNRGYTMLKKTQDALGLARYGVSPESGVSCPNFRWLAQSFGMAAVDIRTWEDFERAMPQVFDEQGPALVEYHMDPEQALLPKLNPIRAQDGSVRSPRFEQLSPELA